MKIQAGRGRGACCTVAVVAMLALSGCYETQVPVVTQQNAHASPAVQDGRYCEVAFATGADAQGRVTPAINPGQCITLTWAADARGWRTNNVLLQGDGHGVSIRARKLGHGADPVGRSSFFLVQAGPPPRQVVMGGQSVSVATARLLAMLPGDGMFAVVNARLPQDGVISRARGQGVALTLGERGLTLPSLSRLTSDGADLVGAWLASELAHEVHAAAFPGTSPEQSVIRIFVRTDAADTEDPGALAARSRAMLEAVVFEAGVLNQALGLGLPPARIDAALLTPPLIVNEVQIRYDGVQRCLGISFSLSSSATQAFLHIIDLHDEAVLARNDLVAGQIGLIQNSVNAASRGIKEIDAMFRQLAVEYEKIGANFEQGVSAYLAGTSEIALPNVEDFGPDIEGLLSLMDIVTGYVGIVADCYRNLPRGAQR